MADKFRLLNRKRLNQLDRHNLTHTIDEFELLDPTYDPRPDSDIEYERQYFEDIHNELFDNIFYMNLDHLERTPALSN